MQRWISRVILGVLATCAVVVLFVFVLGGDGWEPLGPGGNVVGPDGVTLSAGTDTIDGEIEVRIDRADAPGTPLPDGLTALTPVYVISASDDVQSGDDELAIAFPVPDDTPPESLAVAVYMEHGALGHMDAQDPGWILIDMFDPPDDASNPRTMATLVYELGQEGLRVQLVTGVDVVHPIARSGDTVRSGFGVVGASATDDTRIMAVGGGNDSQFSITCWWNKQRNWCSDGLKLAFEDALDDTHRHFTEDLGFPEPAIRRPFPGSSKYRVYLAAQGHGPACKGGPGGQYYSPTKSVIICVNSDNLHQNVRADGVLLKATLTTLVHEYFHATQYAYDKISLRWKAKKQSGCWMWFVEGTANVATSSIMASNLGPGGVLVPGGMKSYPIDVPLTTQNTSHPDRCDTDPGSRPALRSIQYRTEDFFYYLGTQLAPGEGAEFLQPFLNLGAGTHEVSRAIAAHSHPELQDLKHAYWAWAKNHAIERTVPTGKGKGIPCNVHDEVSTPRMRTLGGHPPDSHELTSRNPIVQSYSTLASGRLSHLTSRVIVVQLGAMDTATEVSIDLAIEGPNAWIQAYRKSDCQALDQNQTTSMVVPAYSEDELLILASNGEYGSEFSRNFTVKVTRTVDLSLSIVEPDAREFLEGEEVSFRATAPSLSQNPLAAIQWMHDGPTGPTFYFGQTRSGEATARSFCAGEHVVHASVTGSRYTAEDSISFTVKPDPRREAPECLPDMPSINIIEPADGATFGHGQEIRLRADLSPNELGLTGDDLVWETSDSAILGFGLAPAPGFRDLPVGEHVISVESAWGFASVKIRIAESARPPTASILNPMPSSGGTKFSWWDPGSYNGGHTVDFEGVGSTQFSDEVPDSSLTWASRQHGTNVWRERGTGGSPSVNFAWSGCHVQRYEIRLEVRDTAGVSAFAFVDIRVEPPPC